MVGDALLFSSLLVHRRAVLRTAYLRSRSVVRPAIKTNWAQHSLHDLITWKFWRASHKLRSWSGPPRTSSAACSSTISEAWPCWSWPLQP